MATWSLDGVHVVFRTHHSDDRDHFLQVGPRFLRLTREDGAALWHHSWSEIGSAVEDLNTICLLDPQRKFLRSFVIIRSSLPVAAVVNEIQAQIERAQEQPDLAGALTRVCSSFALRPSTEAVGEGGAT